LIISSVNVGLPQPMKTKSGLSGIFKVPEAGAVFVSWDGLAGDFIADLENHGGVDQAVYIYTKPDLEWWSGQLGLELQPGTFGENILFSELSSRDLCLGDRFLCGAVVLEITSYRMPCATFGARMNDRYFVKKFDAAQLHGAYCRVIVEGEVEAGMAVEHVAFTGPRVTLVEMAEKHPLRAGDGDYTSRLRGTPAHWKTLRDLKRL
jgi:MOSC domain-containing protein YiiM